MLHVSANFFLRHIYSFQILDNNDLAILVQGLPDRYKPLCHKPSLNACSKVAEDGCTIAFESKLINQYRDGNAWSEWSDADMALANFSLELLKNTNRKREGNCYTYRYEMQCKCYFPRHFFSNGKLFKRVFKSSTCQTWDYFYLNCSAVHPSNAVQGQINTCDAITKCGNRQQ